MAKRVRDNRATATIDPFSGCTHFKSKDCNPPAWGSLRVIQESNSADKSRFVMLEVRCGDAYYALTVQPTKATLSTKGTRA